MYTYFDFVNPAVLRLLGSGHSVLDVGCGTGSLAVAASERGHRVTGVELSSEASEVARGRGIRVLTRDATDVEGLERELGERFERVVFADLLEHLPEPVGVLAAYRPLLAPGGRVLVSLPNVAAWTVRLGLLFGRFEYVESGILDHTHLRFFTRASGWRAIEAAGYRVLRCDVTPHLTRAVWPLLKSFFRKDDGSADASAVLNSPAYRFYQAWLEPVETLIARVLPGLFACQFVYEAEVRSSLTPDP